MKLACDTFPKVWVTSKTMHHIFGTETRIKQDVIIWNRYAQFHNFKRHLYVCNEIDN